MMRALAGTALLLLAGAATAADNGIYIGGSIGQANVEVEDDIADFDSDDTGFKVIAGIRPLDFLGFDDRHFLEPLSVAPAFSSAAIRILRTPFPLISRPFRS